MEWCNKRQRNGRNASKRFKRLVMASRPKAGAVSLACWRDNRQRNNYGRAIVFATESRYSGGGRCPSAEPGLQKNKRQIMTPVCVHVEYSTSKVETMTTEDRAQEQKGSVIAIWQRTLSVRHSTVDAHGSRTLGLEKFKHEGQGWTSAAAVGGVSDRSRADVVFWANVQGRFAGEWHRRRAETGRYRPYTHCGCRTMSVGCPIARVWSPIVDILELSVWLLMARRSHLASASCPAAN